MIRLCVIAFLLMSIGTAWFGSSAAILFFLPSYVAAMDEAGIDTSSCKTNTMQVIRDPQGTTSKCMEGVFKDVARRMETPEQFDRPYENDLSVE
ncbi:MAG TPA: hypothetical protein DCL54_11985 [Alphaproteobacteria bacterium]|nr:hypothetical protein [Alphaproteobacteria bacterium]HAJ47287.1 hypothetical protein [Alphaproteobacteria bacterium]